MISAVIGMKKDFFLDFLVMLLIIFFVETPLLFRSLQRVENCSLGGKECTKNSKSVTGLRCSILLLWLDFTTSRFVFIYWLPGIYWTKLMATLIEVSYGFFGKQICACVVFWYNAALFSTFCYCVVVLGSGAGPQRVFRPTRCQIVTCA